MNQVKTIFLLAVLSALLVGAGAAFTPNYVMLYVAIAVVMNFVSYFWSDKIVLRMSGARELGISDAPRLHEIVAELAGNAGIPKPRVYLIPEMQPNAFATGRNPEHGAVAVTQGIMQLLNERELRGVLAHEIGHIKNRDILIASVAATIASAISMIGSVLRWGAILGTGGRDDRDGVSPLGMLAMAIVAPFAAMLIQLGISRSREYEADATGAALSRDPESLANALEKLHHGAQQIPADVAPATASMYIVNPFTSTGGFMNWFSTHPPMAERVARLRGMLIDNARFASR
jgi:heat shock protein HtpX